MAEKEPSNGRVASEGSWGGRQEPPPGSRIQAERKVLYGREIGEGVAEYRQRNGCGLLWVAGSRSRASALAPKMRQRK